MKTLLLTVILIGVCNGQSGKSTRYWDCCKPSCSWNEKAKVTKPVGSCDANGVNVLGMDTRSGCDGGTSYTCNNNQPWAVDSNLSYGFVAGKVDGKSEWELCCACYEITFTSGPVVNKKMVVQITNTGADLENNHFDIQIPGGGVGIFDGCSRQWGAPTNGWGERYGGISARSECDNLPSQIRAGCQWRWDWFQNADNPTFNYVRVTCPTAITDKSGCVRIE